MAISGPRSVTCSKRIMRYTVLVVLVFTTAVGARGQQDSTVEWKLLLQDLEHRLADLPAENSSALDSWRADANDLRASLVNFAAVHPEIQIDIPESLPERAPVEALKKQLDMLATAVDQVIKQSPGSPFHLGTVNVVVSAEASTPALVSDSIDHTEIDEHDFFNIAKAFDYLPGV